MKIALFAAFLFCVSLIVSCSRPTKVTGSIFLRTRAMTSVPMGGVTISVFNDDDFRQHVAKVKKHQAAVLLDCDQFRNSPNQPPADCLSAQGIDAYFEDLPYPLVTATTDAKGEFELVIPKQGSYVLFAPFQDSQRWLDFVDAKGGDQRLVWNDSNLLSDELAKVYLR